MFHCLARSPLHVFCTNIKGAGRVRLEVKKRTHHVNILPTELWEIATEEVY